MSTPALSDTLHRLTHAYKQRLRIGIRNAGIDLPITHVRALKGIARNPEATAGSIAARMQRDKAQITRVLKELEEGGLITRQAHPADRRSQLLRPSRKGDILIAKLQAVEQEAIDTMTRQLKPGELQRFIALANLMADSVTPSEGD
ncbi:MarR family winged helix-turn-helix transcriptional regulator [Parahaliea aestuarii]|uniref:MarR family transcriptional regulator n=1 Tax=Parahaliea aestuarii TaxID=1852021 RepID=A0A5C8ZNS3_9GAMM|nr:MarR family transcriptional regulator [Parahaliea aestuarii]TXS90128.1 MarR family transcriptional regulator [Parahaliea aestuarii]